MIRLRSLIYYIRRFLPGYDLQLPLMQSIDLLIFRCLALRNSPSFSPTFLADCSNSNPDLVLGIYNFFDEINNWKILDVYSFSDHLFISFQIDFYSHIYADNIFKYNISFNVFLFHSENGLFYIRFNVLFFIVCSRLLFYWWKILILLLFIVLERKS